MNCAEFKELMAAYIEDLLDKEKKQSVAEHLKTCAFCRAELKEVSNLRDRLVKNGKVLAHSDLEDAVLGRIIREQNIKLKTTKTSTSQNIWRIIMKSRITKLSAAAVVIIAGVIGVQFLTGTNAYAQVAEQLRKAQSVVFTIITQDNQGNGETVKRDVAYKEPGHLRTSTVDGYVVIVDGTSGKMISIVPGRGYTLAEIDCLNKTDGTGPFASIQAMKNLPAKADETLGTKEIDGIVCDGYKVVTQGDLAKTVWLDAKTGDLVQVELKYASAPGMDRIIKNIKFDVVLDDSLFSLTPPEGYKSFGGELKSDASAETEETFIEFLRWWAGANVDETFPPIVAGSEIAKVVMDMGREGKLRREAWENRDRQLMFRGMLFVARLPASSNWRYAGNGVKVNTPDTPIFWYRPAGVEKYRIIYADLTVREVAEDQLPQ